MPRTITITLRYDVVHLMAKAIAETNNEMELAAYLFSKPTSLSEWLIHHPMTTDGTSYLWLLNAIGNGTTNEFRIIGRGYVVRYEDTDQYYDFPSLDIPERARDAISMQRNDIVRYNLEHGDPQWRYLTSLGQAEKVTRELKAKGIKVYQEMVDFDLAKALQY